VTRLIGRLFGTTIERSERSIVAVLTIDLFLLLTVYYILKVVREPLILLEGGVVSRNAARGAQALILFAIIPLYGALANRVAPRKLVTAVFAFFLVTLLAFPALTALHVPVGFAFFVWLGIFSITTVAQFWSLATDLFTEEAGKRLFALVAAGGTLGAVVGAQVVALLNRFLGPMGLMFLAAVLLAICLLITHAVRRMGESHAPVAHVPMAHPESNGDARGGFTLLLHDRYLLLIGCAVMLLNLVNTTGDQILAMTAQKHAATLGDQAARTQYLMRFYANFQTWISIVTAGMQVFVVARVVRLAGMRVALLMLPMIALLGYGMLALFPLAFVARLTKIVENSGDYSLQNTLQQMLFLPTSRAAKYKAKTATDTFFVRFGDLGSWALVSVALASAWTPRTLAIANTGFAVVWVGIALLLASRYRRLVPSAVRLRSPQPGTQTRGLSLPPRPGDAPAPG
jgi:ATP:ADP antiporter, AAA family